MRSECKPGASNVSGWAKAVPADRVRGFADPGLGASPTWHGFAIDRADEGELRSALGHIVSLYAWKENWAAMVRNAMKGDYSWGRSAEAYLKLFELAVQKRRREI